MSRITLLQSQERLKISKAMTDTAGLRVARLVVLVRLHSSTTMLLNARVVTERRRMMGEFSCCDSCSCRWFRTLITLSHTCQGEVLSGPHCHESRDIDSTIKETNFFTLKCEMSNLFDVSLPNNTS